MNITLPLPANVCFAPETTTGDLKQQLRLIQYSYNSRGCIFYSFSQQPVGEQASTVEEVVSDPTKLDAETFDVAAEIVADLLRDMDTNTAPVVC